MRVVGEAADGPTALSLAAELNPDLVVLEASIPGLNGEQVVMRLQEAGDRKVLVLTACEHKGSLRFLLGVGVRGFVLKRAPVEQLIQAVRAVAGGGTYLDPEVAGDLLDISVSPIVELSAREVQVVRLIALGYSNKEIAARLTLSVKTIETYKTRSMEKLDLRSRVDIVRLAARSGWLDEEASEPLVVSSDSHEGLSHPSEQVQHGDK